MRRVSQFSIGILLLSAISVSAAEQRLEPGYFKWLLHLGQNPVDRFTNLYPPNLDRIALFSGQARFQPRPGVFFDCSEGGFTATSPILVWTPQYDAQGIFADEVIEGDSSQIYHIYVYSPEERQARLKFRFLGHFRVYNNGEEIVNRGGSDQNSEQSEDFLLRRGVNALTLTLVGGFTSTDRMAIKITDRMNHEYSDLTYSLTPPLPREGHYVIRSLPDSYAGANTLDVSLAVRVDSKAIPNKISIIEYVPEGCDVVNSGGGRIIGNAIQWILTDGEIADSRISYSLRPPTDVSQCIAFCGCLYNGQVLSDILGDSVVFPTAPALAWEMAGYISTIFLGAADYAEGQNVAIEHLEPRAYYLVTGLRAKPEGGWATYQFNVDEPGTYAIILDYGAYWTMYHHAAQIQITVDGHLISQTYLYPTTHNYSATNEFTREHSGGDYYRKALWVADTVELGHGTHSLKLTFPQMYPADAKLDITNDGRPVIKSIILTNYPGFSLPYVAEPHHLDSYEHAPANIVKDRSIVRLPDGRLEITFHSTFFSLSQGNEVYSVKGNVRPRVGQIETKFDIVEITPSVFYLPPNGQQDFTLVVQSAEPIPDEYSELIEIWIQGTPASPSNRLHLFSTAANYRQLPPHEEQFFAEVRYASREIGTRLTDPAAQFLPSPTDLGLDMGRYSKNPIQFFEDQYQGGKLPSVAQLFIERGWNAGQPGWTWKQIWSRLLGTLYWHDNVPQAVDYVKRFAEFFPFYPVERRWDWSRPITLPNVWVDVSTMALLTAHVRAAQEDMVDDSEQFRILHNYVLPILQSYYDAMRIRMTLSKDVQEGDWGLPIARAVSYGVTGNPVDGVPTYGYVKVGEDLYVMRWPTAENTLGLDEPLRNSYPKGTSVVPWIFYEDLELEARDLMSLLAIGSAARDSAVIDEVMYVVSEILQKEKIFLADGSFRNEPGSYGGSFKRYPEALLKAQKLFGQDAIGVISQDAMGKMYNALIYALEFPFSNGFVPQLNGGGSMNQLARDYHGDVRILEELFPEDQESIVLYQRISEQEKNRIPGDIIDNHNFVIPGWGYAMLRSEDGSWDRGMETLLSSKYLMSDPGDHVSRDSLGIVICGLGAILTPRYGYSWIGYLPPFLNQVMVDNNWENGYYGSFWHFDGRDELPSAVAHTGDGNGCSELPFERSRWCIQFPEYLFDAYFIESNDGIFHQYDWSLINMGDLEIVEPAGLAWQDYPEFLDGYWPEPGTRGAGPRTIAAKPGGRIIADWKISDDPWVPNGEETLLRFRPEHSGRLRLIMADDSFGILINAQIGYDRHANGEQTQANSQDILVIRKNAVSHAFVDTLESIADDEEAYVKDVVVVAKGNHNQQLVKVTTIEGEDWIYLSGQWGVRPDGDAPVDGIITNADMLAWRIIDSNVTRFYLAGGSYAYTPDGFWNFGSQGNHYITDNDGR